MIKINTTELRNILAKVNALPEADDLTPPEPVLQEKVVTPTKSTQEVTADTSYDGLSKVTVNPIPSEYIVPSGSKDITTNGTHDVTEQKSVNVNVPIPEGYIKPSGNKHIVSNGSYDVTSNASVTVAVPSEEPVLQEKTVTPSTSTQTVTPDSTYDGLSKVTVNAMPTATQATPVITVNTSSGLITAKATQTAGYVSEGSKTATQQLVVQSAKTITPTTSSQIAVAQGIYTTGNITVAAIPSSYVKPSATKGATTYTPKTTNQTISSGTYLTGTQTIKGDSNLVAGNIKKGTSIFGVSGSFEGGEDVTDETNTYTDLLDELEGAVNDLPEAGSGGGGGGGSTGGTCTVEVNLPADVAIFGYGTSEDSFNGTPLGTHTMPGTGGMTHLLPVDSKRIFNNLPIGSFFVLYYAKGTDSYGIKSASITGDIEFSLMSYSTVSVSSFSHAAIFKCNGSGTITVILGSKY